MSLTSFPFLSHSLVQSIMEELLYLIRGETAIYVALGTFSVTYYAPFVPEM